MTPDELFGLHTKPELLRLFPHLPASARKAELLDALRARQPDAKPYRDWHPDAGEAIWRLMAGEVERFRLMFFGNLHQDWSEFVLADLGVFQYERAFRRGLARIPVARRRGPLPGFACLPRGYGRDAAGGDGRAAGRLAGSGQACASANRWLEQRRARCCCASARPANGRATGRRRNGCTRNAPIRARATARIRVHERMTLLPEALALAEQALAAPESEEEAQRVARMLPRLRRALSQPDRRPPGCAPRRVAIWCCPGRRTACRWNWPCATIGTATRRRRTMSRTRCSTRCSACCAGRRCSRRCRAHSSIRSSAVPPTWARPIFRRAAPRSSGLPRAAGHAGVSRRDRAPLPRQAGPAVSLRILGRAVRTAAGAGAGLRAGGSPEARVRAPAVRRQDQPFRPA